MCEYNFSLPVIFYEKLLATLSEARLEIQDEDLEYETDAGYFSPALIDYPETVIPSVTNLQKLIETIFWASIKFEEGNRFEFIVGYHNVSYGVAGNYTDKGFRPKLSISEFKSPRPFDANTLVKLSPAVQHRGNGIVVGIENDELKILGLSFKISKFPLKIKVIDPGELVITFNDSYFSSKPMVHISGNKPVFIKQPYSYMDTRIWSAVKPNISSDNTWSNAKILIIIRILYQMRALSHGGTLVLYSGDDTSNISGIEITNHFTKSMNIDNLVSRVQKDMTEERKERGYDQPGSNYPVKYYIEIENYAKSVASLTAVDGATILDKNINVVGFGAKLLGHALGIEVINYDSRTQEETYRKPIEQSGGTRHQSAIRFVNDNRNAIVFVVSQDRAITAFVANQINQVNAYRNLEVTLA